MNTTLDKDARLALILRIEQLNTNSTPKWGKMTVYQMLKHCRMWEEMVLGQTVYKQSFMGRLFGRIALKDMLSDKPLKPSLPTVPSFKIKDTGDTEAEKQRWIALLQQQGRTPGQGFVHPFFGKLTAEQAGQIAYKHIDHHLRQFGV
ncbi:DUF1569 domain-containing protein [Mucilaginibacter terrenus]|uniref:DUF1569 domain-containing protein n=1 Tax=Mucilaginibacter terrenus TaxID=2482727 RepID=A0A3E2NL30_9SPHI|nr:DUF1569 domain-containing protein [Mucilaginibacter terrenus]RFZ81692.1 DUF1569 domain-containing protein [Mucilaginibacter terrenus]